MYQAAVFGFYPNAEGKQKRLRVNWRGQQGLSSVAMEEWRETGPASSNGYGEAFEGGMHARGLVTEPRAEKEKLSKEHLAW